MAEHIQIHRGCDKYRRLHGKVGGDQHVIGNAVGHLPQGGGGGRCYDHQISP